MENIKYLYTKIKVECIKALVFNIFLNAAIIFLVLHFILSFFGMPYAISLIPAIIYFFKSTIKHIRGFDLNEAKNKDSQLNHIVEMARRSVREQHALSDSLFANLVRRTKTALFLNLITSRRVREKVYIIVVLALLTVLLGSFNLYPTKITFQLDEDIDLTNPTFWGQVFNRVTIEKPEFVTCFDELEYNKQQLQERTAALGSTMTSLNQTTQRLEDITQTNVELSEKLLDTSQELERVSPFEELYERESDRYKSCSKRADNAEKEKISCLNEKATYIQENSELRSRVDDLLEQLATC